MHLIYNLNYTYSIIIHSLNILFHLSLISTIATSLEMEKHLHLSPNHSLGMKKYLHLSPHHVVLLACASFSRHPKR